MKYARFLLFQKIERYSWYRRTFTTLTLTPLFVGKFLTLTNLIEIKWWYKSSDKKAKNGLKSGKYQQSIMFLPWLQSSFFVNIDLWFYWFLSKSHYQWIKLFLVNFHVCTMCVRQVWLLTPPLALHGWRFRGFVIF